MIAPDDKDPRCPMAENPKRSTRIQILITALFFATTLSSCGGGSEGADNAAASSPPAEVAPTATQARVTLPAPQADFEPMSFVNYETPHVRPMAMTPNQQRLLAVNTANNSLMVFDISGGVPVLMQSIPVGAEPVSVNARTNSEVWVVNHLSDTVSIVDLDQGTVINTIATMDEPADVVFAGSPQRAFVTASQVNRIEIFNPFNPQAKPREIAIKGEDPRMLAVSPDGQTVYAAIFESGNATTVVAGGKNFGRPNGDYIPRIVDEVSNPLGPYGGASLIPNDGNVFNPRMNTSNTAPPPVSMIVRKQENGQWLDDNDNDWSGFITGTFANGTTVPNDQRNRRTDWDLPDRDVAIINTRNLQVRYQSGLMNMVMALSVNPRTGRVAAVGTDATNEVRFEPVLNGKFVRVHFAGFNDAGSPNKQIVDLNPHLNYTSTTVPQSERNKSIGDPRSIVWRSHGRRH